MSSTEQNWMEDPYHCPKCNTEVQVLTRTCSFEWRCNGCGYNSTKYRTEFKESQSWWKLYNKIREMEER